MHTFLNQSWRQLVALLAMSIVLSACDSDTLNVVANAGDPNEEILLNNNFLTDAAFAPKITSIELYDICRSGSAGMQCDPTEGGALGQNNNTIPFPGQTSVSMPVRLLVTMNKPVFLDEGKQESIKLENAIFNQPVGPLQPVIAPDGELTSFIEPSNDPASLTAFKYNLFTTRHTGGHIKGNTDGTVTVTFPAGLVYAVNVNGNKYYNAEASATFEYDTSNPVPKLTLIDSQGIIERSRGKMSASSRDFGRLVLEVDWGEEVSDAGDSFGGVDIKDPSLLGFSCTSNCFGGQIADPEYVYFGSDGSGRTLDASKSTDAKYYINLYEADTTGDDAEYLIKLLDEGRLSVKLAGGLVQDKAGNLSKAATSLSLKVDAVPPKLDKVDISFKSARATEVISGQKRTILKIGDQIRYKLSVDEPVFINNAKDIAVAFDVGRQRVRAETDTTQIGQQRAIWDLIYTIKEGDGENNIHVTKPSAYTGQGNSADTTTDWLSDLGGIYNIVTNDKVFDIVDNPINKSNFRDRYFLYDSSPPSGNFVDHPFSFVHVDGDRPKADVDSLLRYSRRLSGDPGTDASIIANGNKLAIAIPFSENLYLSRYKQLDFTDPASWSGTELEASFFSDAFGLQLLQSATLKYDHALTQIAHGDNYFRSHSSTVVYSILVDDTFAPSKSIRLGKLSATPFGVAPTALLDYAGNSFDVNQSSADGFVFDDFLVPIEIDGGPFGITSIYPMYKSGFAGIIAVDPTVVEQKYNNADVLYVGVGMTRPVTASLLTAPRLNLTIKNAAGSNVTASSDSVRFAAGSGGDLKNILVFGFSLNNGLYEDTDGVEVVSLEDPSGDLRDENGTLLDRTILLPTIRGGTQTLEQVRIDNKHPVCTNAFITNSSTGAPSTSPFTIGASDALYMALECDQALNYSQGPNGTGDQAFVWAGYGDRSTDAFDVVFRYSQLVNGGKTLLYSLPIELGYRPGSNGQLLVGELGSLSLRKYYNVASNKDGEFDFFTDDFGNSAQLNFSSPYFVDQPIYEINSTKSGRNDPGAATIDVTPAPVSVRYSVPQDIYVDANGTAYIPGGDANRLDKKNVLTIEVDYGYFDANGNVQLRPLTLDSDENVSINVVFSDSSLVGSASFVKLGAKRSTMIYEMQLPYQSTTPSSLPLQQIQVGDKLNFTSDVFLPYAVNEVITYKTSGAPVTTPSVIDTPIKAEFLATTVGLDLLPDLRVNNKRPTLVNNVPAGQIPVEMWWVDGMTLKQLNPRGEGDNLESLYYGDMYFALVFDEDVSEDSFSDTVIGVQVNTGSTPIRISEQKLGWVESTTGSELEQLNDSSTALSPRKVFYKFSYDTTIYEGTGFDFIDPIINVTSGSPQDIYGNEVDIAAISLIGTTVGYDVTTDSRTDVTALIFDKELYVFDDTINLDVVVGGKLDIGKSLNSGQILALQVEITEDEAGAAPVERVLYMTHVGTKDLDVSPSLPLGQTTIKFQYTLNKATDRFDDDNTSDSNFGIVPIGNVFLCPKDKVSSLLCRSFEPGIFNSSGGILRNAGMGVNDIPGLGLQAGQLAGVNTTFPIVVDSSGSSLATTQYIRPPANRAVPLDVKKVLEVGDTLEFTLPVSLQNAATNDLNYNSGLSDKPVFNFSLFNVGSLADATRQATLSKVDGSNLHFKYEIQPGDYAGTPMSDEGIRLSTGVSSTAKRAAVFNASNLLSSNIFSDLFYGIKDQQYGNPLYRKVLDSTGKNSTNSYEIPASLRVDTRPRATEIISLTDTNPTHSSNKKVEFYVLMNEEVQVSSGAAIRLAIKDSSGTEVDVTAIYSDADRSGDARQPMFQFTSLAGVSGTAEVKALNVGPANTFMRSTTSLVSVNPSVKGIRNTVNDLNFDSAEPKLTGFTLKAAAGATAPYLYSAGKTLEIVGILDKPVDIEVNSLAARPNLQVEINRKSSPVPLRATMYYTGGAASNVISMLFELPINAASLVGAQDYDGLTLVRPEIELPNGSTIVGSLARNPMATTFSNIAKGNIEGFDVWIDVVSPAIIQIVDTKSGVVGGAADYNEGSDIIFEVAFDETVDFINTIVGKTVAGDHYKLKVDFKNRPTSSAQIVPHPLYASLDLDTTTDTTDKSTYYFKIKNLNGFEALAGAVLDSSIIIDSTAGAVIQDKAKNQLPTLLTSAAVRDFSNLRVDAIRPEITAINTSDLAGPHADSAKMKIEMTLSENVTVVGLPSLEVSFDTSNTKIPFAYTTGQDDKVNFGYTVNPSNFNGKSSNAQVKAFLTSASEHIKDSFDNFVLPAALSSQLTPQVPSVVDASLGASIVGVDAWVQKPNSLPLRINPDATTQVYGSKDKLYMLVKFSRSLDKNTDLAMEFTDNSSPVNNTLRFNLITATGEISGSNLADTLLFKLDTIQQGIEASAGITTTGNIIDSGTGGIANNKIRVQGVSTSASSSLAGRFSNDKNSDGVLETVAIKTAPPYVTSVEMPGNTVAAPGYYKENDIILINLTFDVEVQVIGRPAVSVDIGEGATVTTVAADFRSGTNKTLTFEYTVQAGENDSNGIRVRSLNLVSGDSIVNGASGNQITGSVSPVDISSNNPPAGLPAFVDTKVPYQLGFIRAIDDQGDVTGDVVNDGKTDDAVLELVWDLKDKVNNDSTADIMAGSMLKLSTDVAGRRSEKEQVITQSDIDAGFITIISPKQNSGSTPIFKVRVVDLAGNESADSIRSFKVTIDTNVPLRPALLIRDESGLITDDNVQDGETVDSLELVMRVTFNNSDPQFEVNVGSLVSVTGVDDTRVSTTRTAVVIQQNIDDGGYAEIAFSGLAFGRSYAFSATVSDVAGNVSAASSPSITVKVGESPAPASVNPSAFYDADNNDDYNAGDTITLRFNQPIEFSLIFNNKDEIKFSRGSVIGNSEITNTTSGGLGYTDQIRITLKTPSSGDLQLQAGEKLTIPAQYLKNASGGSASVDAVFFLSDTRPAPRFIDPFEHDDQDATSSYTRGDIISLHFNQEVKAGSAKLALENITIDNGKFFGVGASISPTSGSASQYDITLGDNVDIGAGDTATIALQYLENSTGLKAGNDAKFIVIDNAPNKRVVDSVTFEDKDSTESYTSGDLVNLYFNQPITVGLADFDDVSDLNTATGKGFGTGATMKAIGTVSSRAIQFQITLGTGVTLVDDDMIIVSKSSVQNALGISPTTDIAFTLPDITRPFGTNQDANGDSVAITIAKGTGNSAYGLGSQLELLFSEPINASLISAASIVNSGNLGSPMTAAVRFPDSNGLGSSVIVTLGTGANVTQGDTITINRNHVMDKANNKAKRNIQYTLNDFDSVAIKDVSVDSRFYLSGEKIEIRLQFTAPIVVELNGSGIALDLNVGGSEVEALYVSVSSSDTMKFVYTASGVIDTDGIEVTGNSMALGIAQIKSNGIDVGTPSFATQHFPGVTVNAPFDFSKVTDIWFDSTDIDADGDTTDQADGDAVKNFYDKSGRDNHINAGSRIGAEVKAHAFNNSNLSVFFNGDQKYALNTLKSPGLGASSYTYFVAASLPNPLSNNGHRYFFGTRTHQDGVGLLRSYYGNRYHLNSAFKKSDGSFDNFGSEDVGTIVKTSSMFMSDSLIPGIERVYSQGGLADEFPRVNSSLIPGTTVSMGALVGGSQIHAGRLYINEVLYFNRALTLAEKTVVENYLGAKWNSPHSTRDYYIGDDTAQGDYDDEVTGILKLSGTRVSAARAGALLIAESASDGFLKDDTDSVFLGSKGAGVEVITGLQKLTGSKVVHSTTQWYLDIRDGATKGGSIDISIDPQEIGINATGVARDYELIWRESEGGAFQEIALGREVVNGLVVFRNLSLQETGGKAYATGGANRLTNGYITVAYVDNAAPKIRSAEVIENDKIIVRFDEAIKVASPSFSLSNGTVISTALQPGTTSKVLVETSGAGAIKTLVYSGAGITDVAGNQVTSLPHTVVGTSGVDTITLTGASFVVAGTGDDIITASPQADVFDYNFVTDGADTINSFTRGIDTIDLSDLLQYSTGQDITKFIELAVTSTGVRVGIDRQGQGNTELIAPGTAGARDVAINFNGSGLGSTTSLQNLIDDGTLVLTSP